MIRFSVSLVDLACQILARLSVSVCPVVSAYDSRYCKLSFLARRHIRRWDPDSQPALNTGSNPVSPTIETLVGGGSCQAMAEGVFGPPVSAGRVGFVEAFTVSRRWMALAPTLTYATS